MFFYSKILASVPYKFKRKIFYEQRQDVSMVKYSGAMLLWNNILVIMLLDDSYIGNL